MTWLGLDFWLHQRLAIPKFGVRKQHKYYFIFTKLSWVAMFLTIFSSPCGMAHFDHLVVPPIFTILPFDTVHCPPPWQYWQCYKICRNRRALLSSTLHMVESNVYIKSTTPAQWGRLRNVLQWIFGCHKFLCLKSLFLLMVELSAVL